MTYEHTPIKVLLLQPNPEDTSLLLRLISSVDIAQFEFSSADSVLGARQKMSRENTDILLLDLAVLQENVRETLRQLVSDFPMTSVMIVGDEKTADFEHELLQMGVQDFINRSQITGKGLERVIRNSLDRKNLLRELHGERYVLNEMFEAIEKGEVDLAKEAKKTTPLFRLVDNFLMLENTRLLNKVREQEVQLKRLTYRDSLTGLDNGPMFEHTLKRYISFAKRRKTRLGLLSLDINQFKLINENYGQLLGDQVLRQLAVRLSKIFRLEDCIARQSGDNFSLIVTEHKKTADLSVVARKIIDSLSEPFVVGEAKILLSISIGISEYPQNGENAATLMKNADIALQSAKKLGQNMFQFATDELCGRHLERLHLENDLVKALKENQFLLVYQPILDLKSKKVVAVEALLRWRHPSFGVINPLEFLPLAERTGYIVEIGRWVIAEAFSQLKAWRSLNLKNQFKMSINLSPAQFHDTQLTQCISEQLKQNHLTYQDVEFDVTEKALVQDEVSAVKILQHIASLGGAASIDDFGTGFHSFEQINSLPLATLKIASRYVQKINQSDESNKMVKIIINLARQLGLYSLAEAVETAEQLEFLEKSGCDRAQGYFISKPISPQKLEKFLREHE